MTTNEQREISILKSLLEQAVQKTYAEADLLVNREGKSRKGIEQSIAFRVGIHLQELLKTPKFSAFSALNLDCEYNKYGDDPKATLRFPDGIRPDLLIHSRGNQDSNKLAVEFKGWWNTNHRKDIQKLKDLTSDVEPYKYSLGALVIFNNRQPKYVYFQHGQET